MPSLWTLMPREKFCQSVSRPACWGSANLEVRNFHFPPQRQAYAMVATFLSLLAAEAFRQAQETQSTLAMEDHDRADVDQGTGGDFQDQADHQGQRSR